MTMRDVVAKLEAAGYDVEVYERKDGGILIKEINGQKFSGAKGNIRAREILNVDLSAAKKAQLSRNVEEKIKKPKLDEEIKKEIKKTQRKWKEKKVQRKGKITTKKVREHLKREGKKSALYYLKRQQRYAEGYAYSENVQGLCDRIRGLAIQYQDMRFSYLADKIEMNIDNFKEAWISPSYYVIYECEQGALNPDECLSRLSAIIKL